MMEHQDCKRLLGSLSEFIDGELEAELCAQIERHLAECPDCRVVVDTLKKTVYLYHATSQETRLPEGVRDRLYRRLEIELLLDEK